MAIGGESCSIHGRPDVTSRYEVLGHAGSGAYADVYRGRRRSNGAAVALKEVHDAISAQREADALLAVASESSPHVVALLDHFPGSDQDDDVLVLEWLPLDLAAFVRHGRRAGGSLPWRRSRRLDQAMDAAGDQRHRRLPPCRRRAPRPQARKPAHLGGRGAQGRRLWSDVQKGLSSKGASTCGAWNYCSEIDWC